MRKINIFVTLGPSSLNKDFLKYINEKVSLVRLNMSHVGEKDLKRQILFIKKNCKYQYVLTQKEPKLEQNYLEKKELSILKNIIFLIN